MNINEIRNIKNIKTKILLLGAAILIISLALYIVFYPGQRAVLLFESMDDSKLYSEHRYIPRGTAQGDLHYFVDELLLGPTSDRYKPLFAHGTKALSCFLNDENILYIHLNENALFSGNSSSDTVFACELLKINVLKNYKYVDNIRVFIMGNLVAEM